MGHSYISVTINVHTNISLDNAEEELKRMDEFRKAQAEIEKKKDAIKKCARDRNIPKRDVYNEYIT